MKFLSLTGLIAIRPITKERSVVTFLDIILTAICRRIVKALLTNTGTTATGMTMTSVVLNTEMIGFQMVNLEMDSKSGLNATSLLKTQPISQNVVQEKRNVIIMIATSMEIIVKMNFGTNATGKS